MTTEQPLVTTPHPLITSIQTLVDQACSVPQEEAYLAKLTEQLAQVADDRARCVERLETGRRAAVQLDEAQTFVTQLLNPPAPLGVIENCTFRDHGTPELNGSSNSGSISESIPVLEFHETEAKHEPEFIKVPPSADAGASHLESEPDSQPSNSELNSEPELIAQPRESDSAPALSVPERILAALAPDRQLTSRQLADELGLTTANISGSLSKMVASDRLRNDATYPPRYRLPGVAEASRDQSDRQAIAHAVAQTPVHTPPPVKTKPITSQDEQAVLGALLARPTRRGSAALLSGKARMSTDRVTEVLIHLAESGRVVAPTEGEHLWSLA